MKSNKIYETVEKKKNSFLKKIPFAFVQMIDAASVVAVVASAAVVAEV